VGGACRTHGGMRNAYKAWCGKSEGKKSLARCRRRWKDNSKMHLNEITWGTWNEFICLKIGSNGGIFFLKMVMYLFGFSTHIL
jgi:hypothetical protein